MYEAAGFHGYGDLAKDSHSFHEISGLLQHTGTKWDERCRAGFRDIGDLSWICRTMKYGHNVGKTIVNHPPNHHKIGVIDEFQMGGLLLFYPH